MSDGTKDGSELCAFRSVERFTGIVGSELVLSPFRSEFSHADSLVVCDDTVEIVIALS